MEPLVVIREHSNHDGLTLQCDGCSTRLSLPPSTHYLVSWLDESLLSSPNCPLTWEGMEGLRKEFGMEMFHVVYPPMSLHCHACLHSHIIALQTLLS